MMALTMACVSETVPKEKTGSAMGLLGTMSAIGTTLGPSLGGLLIAGLGWRAIFLVNVPLGILNFLLAYRHLPVDRRKPKADRASFDSDGHAGACSYARGLCACHDNRTGQIRCAQHGSAIGSRLRCRPFRASRGKSRITFDPIGDVPQSSSECGPRHEHARLDSNDVDPGGRAVLPFSRARARSRTCWTRPIGRPAGRGADRRAGGPHRGPFWRTTHDHRRAHWNSGRLLRSILRTGEIRHSWIHHPHGLHHRQLCTVPGGQQHRNHGRYPRRPTRRHFRHAQPVTQSRTDHGRLRHGGGICAGIGDDQRYDSASRGCCGRYADHVRRRRGSNSSPPSPSRVWATPFPDQKISRRPSCVLRGSPKPRPGADPPLRVDVIWPKLPDENVVPGLA